MIASLVVAAATLIGGPAEWFTGRVTITSQFQRELPSRVGGAIGHFEPAPAPPGISILWVRR